MLYNHASMPTLPPLVICFLDTHYWNQQCWIIESCIYSKQLQLANNYELALCIKAMEYIAQAWKLKAMSI